MTKGGIKAKLSGKLFNIHERICEVRLILNYELSKNVHTKTNRDCLVFLLYSMEKAVPYVESAIRNTTNLKNRGRGRPRRLRCREVVKESGEAE